jgi:uncharacterized protein (TIGR03437 family)
MSRAWLALALLFAGSARGQAPSYSAASIVNAANGAPGPFAPNSILTIYGSGLARSTHAVTADDIQQNQLPSNLDSTSVYVGDASGGVPAPLLYISNNQINFILAGNIGPDPVVIHVVREGQYGPAVTVELAPAAPALFTTPAGYIVASHPEYPYPTITTDSPAHAGEIVILWATGLGKTVYNSPPGQLPTSPSPLVDMTALQITVAGSPVDSSYIQYAGVTATQAALYQINLVLPASLPADPEIRVTVSGQSSAAGPKLALR